MGRRVTVIFIHEGRWRRGAARLLTLEPRLSKEITVNKNPVLTNTRISAEPTAGDLNTRLIRRSFTPATVPKPKIKLLTPK